MGDYNLLAEWNMEPNKDTTAEYAEKFEDVLSGAEIPMKALMNLNIVFDEIYANICSYSKASEMTLRLGRRDSDIIVEFIDNGIAFDPTKVVEADITKSAEEREIGGLGIHMVKKMTNSMTYEYADGLNHLTLIKNC